MVSCGEDLVISLVRLRGLGETPLVQRFRGKFHWLHVSPVNNFIDLSEFHDIHDCLTCVHRLEYSDTRGPFKYIPYARLRLLTS